MIEVVRAIEAAATTVAGWAAIVAAEVEAKPELNWVLAAALLAVLYGVYRFVLFPPFDKTRGEFKGNFHKDHPAFVAKRHAAFPPPWPNGWFKLCDVADLDKGNVVSVEALGISVVVFRGASGKIGVLDAFCPHMGAHLGKGGTVVGDCLRCPFHLWTFSTDGQAVKIPYSTAPVPKTARTRTHNFTVFAGMVWLWFHVDGEPPLYPIEPKPFLDSPGWRRVGAMTTSYRMHIADVAENSADYEHFNTMHGAVDTGNMIIDKFVKMSYETRLHFPPEPNRQHICYFDNISTVWLLRCIPFRWYHQKVVVTFEGPGLVHFDVQTPLGRLWLIKSLIPREPFDVYSEDVWFAENRTPRWLASIVAKIAKGALEQDRLVWEHRRYERKPFLVKGDGPFMQYRNWWSRHYSDNSERYAADVAAGRERASTEW